MSNTSSSENNSRFKNEKNKQNINRRSSHEGASTGIENYNKRLRALVDMLRELKGKKEYQMLRIRDLQKIRNSMSNINDVTNLYNELQKLNNSITKVDKSRDKTLQRAKNLNAQKKEVLNIKPKTKGKRKGKGKK